MTDTEPMIASPEAEQAVLGAMLMSPDAAAEVATLLKPTDFWEPAHERVFDAIVNLSNAGNPHDPVAVAQALGKGLERLPGGATYLHTLYSSVGHAASADYYAGIVADKAVRRRIAAAGTQLQLLADSDLDRSEVIDRSRSVVEDATEQYTTRSVTSLGGVLPEMVDIAQHGKTRGLATPWDEINHLIGGVTPGRFVVIGARPGIGKSVMGTNLALHTSDRHQQPSFIASLEMGAAEIAQRLIACKARVDLSKLEHGTVDDWAWGKLGPAVSAAMDLPIVIDDQSQQTIASIRAGVRSTIKRYGACPLVVVDYIQLVTPRDRRVNRSEQIGEITRDLKIIGREFETCVVAMSQVNREGAQRHEPTLADLRESGSIEADADVVILLHRPEAPEDQLPPLEAIVAKNRSGPVGRAQLAMQGHYARITGYRAGDEDRYR